MAGDFDVSELMKVLPGVTCPHSSDYDSTVWKLISVKCDTIIDKRVGVVTILLQKNPRITCDFSLKYSEESIGRLRASIQFQSEEPYKNLKYKASLHIKSHSQASFIFVEDLNIQNITELSTFHFSHPFICTVHNNYRYLFLQISRKINNFSLLRFEIPKSKITQNLSLLYKDKLYTDVKIVCQNQEFSAHKLVLIASSPVFRAMFEHRMRESLENKIKITDIEPEILDHLLRFIYTDTVEELKEGQTEKLLAAADKYALDNLKLICVREISKSVKDVSEAFNVLAIAERYNVSGFRDIFLDYVQENRKKE